MVVDIPTPGHAGGLLAVAHLRAGGGDARPEFTRITLAPDAPGACLGPAWPAACVAASAAKKRVVKRPGQSLR